MMSIGSRICFDVDIERAAAPPCKREHGDRMVRKKNIEGEWDCACPIWFSELGID
jgi:hypothetical protein